LPKIRYYSSLARSYISGTISSGCSPTEDELISAAVALGADELAPWSEQEVVIARAARGAKRLTKAALSTLRDLISRRI